MWELAKQIAGRSWPARTNFLKHELSWLALKMRKGQCGARERARERAGRPDTESGRGRAPWPEEEGLRGIVEAGSGSHLREVAFRGVNRILEGGLLKHSDVVDLGFHWFVVAVRFQIDCREGNVEAENTNDSKTQIKRNINETIVLNRCHSLDLVNGYGQGVEKHIPFFWCKLDLFDGNCQEKKKHYNPTSMNLSHKFSRKCLKLYVIIYLYIFICTHTYTEILPLFKNIQKVHEYKTG